MSRDEKMVRGQEPIRKPGPEADAKGQSETNHMGGTNDGVTSANPRVLSHKKDGDATFPIKRGK